MSAETPNQTPGTSLPKFADPLLAANFTNPKQKQDREFGRKLMSRIYQEQAVTSSSFFFGGRNLRWIENTRWAMGRQNMNEFLDLTGIDGTKAYTNIDYTQNRQGPQFVETLVSSMSSNDEYPCVYAIDEGSLSEKEQRKFDALFRMHDVETVNALQEESGIMLEPPDAYVPDDPLSAEVYFKLEDRLPKEIEFEQKLEKVLSDNDYDILKRRSIRDLIVLNCAVTKIEKLDNGYIGIRKCTAPNMIYNFFMSDSGKMELSYIGEVYSLKVRDLRKRYGKSEKNPSGLSEKELFEACQSANRMNVANKFFYAWNDTYMYTTDRPYDDYSIPVFDCEIKVFDTDYYVSKTDNFGKENIQAKKGIPNPESDKAKVLTTNKFTVYRGVWGIDSNKMIFWGYPDVVIKPFMDISESLFSYSINIPNNDGEYIPSLFERALEPLRELTLAKLKRKQLIAEMVPPGYTMDVARMRDVDVGGGNIWNLDEILKIRNQKGVIVWSSQGLDPMDVNNQPPIVELANAGSVQQLQELTNIIATCIQDIRSLLGVPLYRDGSDVGDRTAAKLAEGQNQSSFNVTDFITTGFHQLMEETLHKICMIQWDEVVLKENRDDLLDTRFEVKVEMKTSAYEKELLEQNIQIAMKSVDATGAPLLSFKDAFRIRNIKNYKMAELYLSNMVEKNLRESRETSAMQQKQNGEIQQQSLQAKAQADAELMQQKAQIDISVKQMESTNKKTEIALQGLFEMAKSGLPIPDYMYPVIASVVPNIQLPLMAQNQQMQQDMQQKAEEEQAQAQQEQQINQIAQETGMSPEEVMAQMQQQQGQPQQQVA